MHTILFIDSGKSGGGSAESMYQHLRVIDRQRFRPVVVYLNHHRYVQLVSELGVPVHVLTDWLYSRHIPRYIDEAVFQLRRIALRLNERVPTCYLMFARMIHWPLVSALERLVKRENVDIIHLNTQIGRDLFGLFVAEKTDLICISHLRSTNPVEPQSSFNRYTARYANNVVTGYIANSKMTQDHWVAQGVDAEKTWLVHNGTPLVDTKPLDIRKTWAIGDDISFIIGCIAPLRNPLKVDPFLLKAFAHFVERHPDALLMIVGDGPMRDVLAQEARALRINNRVLFAGFQKRVTDIIAGLDVSLIYTAHDSFSRVVLETMQARTPLVATDAGGIREVVQHEHNGLLIDYGNEKGFTKALERLLSDQQLRSRLVENGYRTIQERFSIEHYASEIEQIYMEVLEEKKATKSG